MFQTSLANISVTIELWIQVFWVISVQFDLRNTLPKSGPFLLLHPVCVVRHGTSRVSTEVPDFPVTINPCFTINTQFLPLLYTATQKAQRYALHYTIHNSQIHTPERQNSVCYGNISQHVPIQSHIFSSITNKMQRYTSYLFL